MLMFFLVAEETLITTLPLLRSMESMTRRQASSTSERELLISTELMLPASPVPSTVLFGERSLVLMDLTVLLELSLTPILL